LTRPLYRSTSLSKKFHKLTCHIIINKGRSSREASEDGLRDQQHMCSGQDRGMADITKVKNRLGCAYHDYLASFMSGNCDVYPYSPGQLGRLRVLTLRRSGEVGRKWESPTLLEQRRTFPSVTSPLSGRSVALGLDETGWHRPRLGHIA
jgi:hypothetical protein